jgi:hypothetical protein
MRIKRLLMLVVVGVIASATLSWAVDCVNDPVPCEGPEVLNGWGCGSGCPPTFPNDGCCSYQEFRVNCDEGPDQFYRKRSCAMLATCSAPMFPKALQCTHL